MSDMFSLYIGSCVGSAVIEAAVDTVSVARAVEVLVSGMLACEQPASSITESSSPVSFFITLVPF